MGRDVPAACDVKLLPEQLDVAGALTTPTPTKDDKLTPLEEKLVEVAADVAALVAAKASGAKNTPA